MRKNLIFFLMILATMFVQIAITLILPVFMVTPNLLLALAASFGFMRGRHAGVLIGFVSGILADVFIGGGLFGMHALVYAYIGFICGFFSKKYFDDDLKMPLLLIGVSDLVFGTIVYIIEAILHRGLNFPLYFGRTILPEAVATVLVSILLYRLYHWISVRVTAREIEEQNSPWLRG